MPLTGVGDADRIKMAIIEQNTRAAANASQDIAHGVAPHLIEAQISHTSAYSISNRANLAIITGNGNQIAQELYHGVMLLCQFLLHSTLCFVNIHNIASPTFFAKEHARVLVPARVYALHRL